MRAFLMIAAALMTATTPAIAHPGGHGEDGAAQTPDRAARAIMIRMITQSRLAATWSRATLVGTRERQVRGVHQTIVTFRNDAETNAAHRLLHVALNQEGELISTTHSAG